MKFLISTLIQKINQAFINSGYRRLAKHLLNHTDKQLKDLGLNRYAIINIMATQDWKGLNFNKTNHVNTVATKAINLDADYPANDEVISSAA
jgi:uncharacterized protein YjiS (DUF1127 family)